MRFPLLILAGLLLTSAASGQKPKRKCTGTAPDSTLVVRVYRDCDVDEPAKIRGSVPNPDMTSLSGSDFHSGCLRTEVEFIVDTLGVPELSSVHAHPGNDRGLEQAVLLTLRDLRYYPAQLAGRPVRQLVLYKVSMKAAVRVTTSSGAPVGLPPTRPGPC